MLRERPFPDSQPLLSAEASYDRGGEAIVAVLAGEVFLVVGPALPSLGFGQTSSTGDNRSVSPKREIAFIDHNVDDLGTLLAGIRPDVEPILLLDNEPAPLQMARAVKGRAGLEAIHVIAHGRPGEVSFGAGALSLDNVDEYAAELSEVGLILGDGAFQLWTCESGQGKRGVAFVDALARASGAQVAASTQLVGAAARGGWWELTRSSGDIAVRSPLTAAGMAGYAGVLAAASWKTPGTSGNWSNGSNWTGGTGSGGVPGSADAVTIGAGSSAYVVTVDTAALASSIRIASQSSTNTTTLTLTTGHSVTTSGAISFSDANSTINGAGTVTAGGGITGAGKLRAGTNSLGGTLDVFGTIASGVVLQIGTAAASDLKIEGTATSAAAITINNANQTLEIGAAGNLTINAAQTVSLGKIKLDGGTLTNASGITLGSGTSNGVMTGFGKVAAAVSHGGTGTASSITATGGTLEVTGAVTGINTLAIGSGATDKLLLDGASSTATAVTFAGSTGTIEINTSGSLTVTNALAVGANTVKLDGASSTLTDGNGITLAGGTISGLGHLAANTNVTGYGTVSIPISSAGTLTASGGTLDLTGTVSGRTLAIATASASDLKIDGTATSAAAITINNANQTLEIGAAGNLTINAAQTVSLGKIKLDGGTLTNASGITLGSGTSNGVMTGFGKVAAAVSHGGTGTASSITATGGTLEVTGAVTGINTLAIGSGATDKLLLDGASSTATAVTFAGSTGTIEINTSGSLTVTNALAVGANTVKLDGASSTLTDGNGITLAGGTISGLGHLAANTNVTGYGTVSIPISSAGTLTASGGTLDLTGTVSGRTLAIATASASDLKIDGTATSAAAITINNANQTLEIGAAGNLTINAAQTVSLGKIKLDGGTLTNASGITLGSGTSNGVMTGFGKVAAAVSHGGTGTASSITATGGTLEVTGAVTGINTLAIGSGATDKLLLDGASSTATAVTFAGSTGTIEINTSGSLTVTNALAVGANTVKLDGASSTLTDGNGITLAGGTISGLGHLAANTNVTGYGTVSIPISTADTITASGGTLDLTNAITTNSTLDIANSSASILKLDGNVSSSSTLLAFLGSAGTIELTDVVGGALQFSGKIAGLNVGASSTIPTNDVNVQGLTITSATLSGSSIILKNGTTTVGTLALVTAPAAGTYVAISSDATLGGTDVFLTAPTTVTWSPSTETGVEGSAINLGTVTPASTNILSAVVISGIPVDATLSDNNGHSSSGSTSVNILGWNYAGLTITAANDTNLILAVQVTDTAGNVSTIATESVTVNPLAATVTPATVTGVEGSALALNLAVTVNGLSGDANSLATLTLSGATAGAVLTDGVNTHTFIGPSDTFDIHTWNLSTLTIKPASDTNFTLTVAATEKDAAGNLSATTTATDAVTVNPLAPTVTPVAATGVEGSAIALNLGATVNGLSGDANSLATLTLSGATAGAVLTDGINTHTFTGQSDTFDIHTWNLSTLTINAASATNFTLTVAATEQDAAGNFSTPTINTEVVTINAAPNAIVLENEKPGTPQSIWQIDPGEDSTQIQGFTTAISTNLGAAVQFKIDNLTGNPNYHIDIYRLGYYGGDGARLVTTLQHQAGTSVVQPAPITDAATGEVDAGNWSVTNSWTVPTTAVSGVYVANVIDGNQVFQIPFVVRDDSSHSDIVFQTDDETWQAYNAWGGSNVYGGIGPGVQGAAYAVSYNRPITTRDGSGGAGGGEAGTSNDMVFSAEYPAIYWLEENGYNVSYISGIDAATNGSLLLNHKVYMDVGHDEYWTDSQRANVQAAADAGVSLMFLSGNEMYWQTRLAPSIDSTPDPNRTLITYKDTHYNAVIDPTGTATGTFMDPRFASSGGMSGIPSNSLTGTVFQVDSDRTDIITIPYGMTQLRFWRNTAVANTAPNGTASLAQNILGYEWDSSPDNGFRPGGLVDLSSTTLQVNTYLLDYGNTVGNGTATHNLVEYRDPVSGAIVFGAGTVFWSWGLASDHDQNTGATTPIDPNVQQATVNLLADMGVQPATLQASLMIASQSTDHTAPTSTITRLSATSVVEGQSVTVTGTAADVGGVIGGVEVSSDGGNTWHPATGAVGESSVTWAYTFTAGAPGTVNIKSRAVDDSLNLENPSSGAPLKITPASNLTIFSPTDTPAVITNSDPNAAELGFKFVSAASGEITGIRFYKGPQNTGTHLGDLWTSSGQLLASATFTNETASGWQQVNFATPVHVQAGVTYIASYHTDAGQYSTTDFYFDNSGHTNGALTATGNGLNGVYAYGAGPIFPSNVSIVKGDNYWVDVVFNDTSLQPQANNDSGFAVTENGVLSIPASTLLANDTDPAGLPFSITSVSNPANGTVSYDAQTQTVTFTPAAGYAGAANFTYTITDSSGASGSGQVSLNVAYPISAQSLFGTSDTPSVLNASDTGPVELGVKFTASANGLITGIRFYKGPSNTGTHVADLWNSTGTLLTTATFTSESASGWQQVNFTTPVAITAGTTYVAAYRTTNGNYSDSPNYFTSPIVNGELTAPATSNGVYAYGAGGVFPTNSFKSANYFVDVVFDGSNQPIAEADGGFVVNENGSISIAASALLANDADSGGFSFSIQGVSNPQNGTVSYNASAQTVTFVPTANYNGMASFTYTIGDTNGGTASAVVSVMVNNPAAETLFSLGSTPNTVTVNDVLPVELGVKFTAAADGLISGLRFYKGPQNTGPHVADLWSSDGTLLATATFTDETASGWQQVNFATPVAVTAGATYAASYHTSGDYSADSNYFANPVVSGDLTAPSAGNGVYAYGADSVFPTNTYGGSNYWVDVVYTKSPPRPIANNDSGFVINQNGSITISVATLMANDSAPDGLPLSFVGVASPLNGTVSYDANAQAVTFVPNASYVGAASFNYTISDINGSATATAALFVNSAGTESLFSLSSIPATPLVNDTSSVELGVKFTADANGLITGLRFYKGAQNAGPHVADLWGSDGTLLATAAFSNETAVGWQQVNFATPVAITAGTTYVASYHTNGDYSADANYFANPLVSGDLTATSTGNGVFAYGTGSNFPNENLGGSNYWVDVVYTKTQSASPPVANNDSGFVANETGSVTIAASTLLANDTDPNGQALSITGVSNASNGTVSYDANAQTITFTPTAGYTGAANFTYSIADTSGATASASASLLVNDPTTFSIFNPATAPLIAATNDPSAIEVGVKFTAAGNGDITGLRFYKGPGNTGTHVADLWSSDGTLLATATFANEAASGWQQVNFSAPVAITTGATYVASYHTNSGDYAADPNLFETSLTNGPLTAPSSASSGGNGVYAYGSSSLFPTNNFNSTSYGVDVVFKPQLAT